MADAKRQADEGGDDDATSRSGARRLRVHLTSGGNEPMPPTPAVLVARPRISTGQYSIIRPRTETPKE